MQGGRQVGGQWTWSVLDPEKGIRAQMGLPYHFLNLGPEPILFGPGELPIYI